MKRSKYTDGVEVHQEDLNNTETTKAEAIKERQRSFTQSGSVIGLKVTPNGLVPSHIDIGYDSAGGVGYCPNGERIEVESAILDNALEDESQDTYNFVTLVYTEVESDYKRHEADGQTYPTRVSESYEVSILTEINYNSLSVEAKENRIVVGIVRSNGPGKTITTDRIQTSLELPTIITSSPIDIDGIWLLRFSDNTVRGTGSFNFVYSGGQREIQYAAPEDEVSGSPNYGESLVLSGDGDYLLSSGDTDYWCRIRVVLLMTPITSSVAEVDVTALYNPPVEGSTEYLYPTPTATAKDRLHRSKLGSGLPTTANPHGLTYEDLTGGFTDVTRHQDLMHANGIVSPTWEDTGGSNALSCSINVGRVEVIQPGDNEFFFVHGLGFSTIEGGTTVVWETSDPPGTYQIAVGTDQRLHKSLTAFDQDDYLVLCSVDVTVDGGNRLLGNLIDLRKFATTATGNIQDEAITSRKIADGAVKQIHLWANGDQQTIEALVKGPNSNADHLHTHSVEDPEGLFYLKPQLYAPQATEPNETGSVSGANLVGYKNPLLDKEGDEYGDLFPENVHTIQAAIDQLASLMRTELARECPQVQEIMHTSGRMLNLTFVPLPDNHLNGGLWKDGSTPVTQDQCSWIVSPSFLWGASAVHIPWMYLCSTFGGESGGDYPTEDNIDDWRQPLTFLQKWWDLFNRFLNGQLFYGRYLITFVFFGADNALVALLAVLGVWCNYHITATNPKPIED
jgi:hypothetical protein